MRTSVPAWFAITAALTQTTTAFYPYSFDTDGTSISSRTPSVHSPARPAADLITLPLRRMPSPIRPRQNIYNILNSNEPTQPDSVAIDQDGGDLSYMVAVRFGDSKEEYHLLLDSAASNTWVMGSDCTTDSCKTHTTFGTGDSSTLKQDSKPFSVTYGTGSARGTLATDTLHIGSLSPSLTFGLANNVSREFRSYPMDGILGIGRGTTTPNGINAPQVMDVLASSNLIGSKRYGIHLSRSTDNLLDGELNLGTLNPARYTDPIAYTDCVPNDTGFWEIPLTDAGVDGTALGLKGKSAILDTGTSFILMPQPDAEAMHALIPGSQQSGETFFVPCDTRAVLQFTFGSIAYNISTRDWRGGKLASGLCRSNIVGRQTFGADQWLVGDVFLKNVYAVFDFEQGSVGFGVVAPGGSAAGTTTATSTESSSSGGDGDGATSPSTSVRPAADGTASSTTDSGPPNAKETQTQTQTQNSAGAQSSAGRTAPHAMLATLLAFVSISFSFSLSFSFMSAI